MKLWYVALAVMELNWFCCDFFCFSLLNDNEIGRIKSDGLFGRLLNLQKLDLRRNRVTGIEENAFEGAARLTELYVIATYLITKSSFFSFLPIDVSIRVGVLKPSPLQSFLTSHKRSSVIGFCLFPTLFLCLPTPGLSI